MLSHATELGAFIRWILKGCKTKFKDEMEGNFPATWGPNYDVENTIIGIATIVIIIAIFITIKFVIL